MINFTTFAIVLLIAFIVWNHFRYAHNFNNLIEGGTYRSRDGKVVTIDYLIMYGGFDIYRAEDGNSYYHDGSLVGDNMVMSPHKLVNRIS